MSFPDSMSESSGNCTTSSQDTSMETAESRAEFSQPECKPHPAVLSIRRYNLILHLHFMSEQNDM